MNKVKVYPGMRVTAMAKDETWRSGRVLWVEDRVEGVCVEFDGPVPGGHDGNDFRFSGKDKHCYWVGGWKPEKTPAVRVAMTPDGCGVNAIGSGCRGESRVKDNPFDYAVGGVMAFARALGRDPAEVCRKTLSVLPETESGPVPMSGDDAQVEKTPAAPYIHREVPGILGLLFNEKLPLHPNLTPRGIGKKTPYRDADGKLLVTGDVVQLSHRDTGMSEAFYVLEDPDGTYIDGVKSACDPQTGKIRDDLVVKKIKRYCDVPDGERHNFAVMRR